MVAKVLRKGNGPEIIVMGSEAFDSAELERGLVDISDNGARKLAGVKFIKEETGWGLREAKDFVDDFFKRKEVYNR